MSVTINGSDGITTPSLEVDSTTLVVDEVNNRVGIGTSSPAANLQITGASGSPQFGVGTSANAAYFNAYDNNPMYFTASASNSTAFGIGASSNIDTFILSNNAEVGRFKTNGEFAFNSGYGSVATAYGVRAWVNFNGTGTVAIRDSGNVSSVTDLGTGIYGVNFTNAMPDVNYSALTAGNDLASATDARQGPGALPWSTTQLRIQCGFDNGAPTDWDWVSAAVIR